MLIACEGERRAVAEDYRDELEHLLDQAGHESEALHVKAESELPEGWDEFARQLDQCQLQTLRALCLETDPASAVNRIAEENATMPQFLLDSINQVALDTIGDIIILPDTTPPTIEEDDIEAVRQVVGAK
jgi:hypothetical protein